jgi:hypothetical protein
VSNLEIGSDASNLREGGGLTHGIELLRVVHSDRRVQADGAIFLTEHANGRCSSRSKGGRGEWYRPRFEHPGRASSAARCRDYLECAA